MAVKDRKGGVFLVESLEKAPMHDDDRCVHNLVPDGSAAFMSGGGYGSFHCMSCGLISFSKRRSWGEMRPER